MIIDDIKVTVIGLGKFGAEVIEQTKYNSVVIDWRTNIFSNSNADYKIRIRKNEDPPEEVFRSSNRFKKILNLTDVVFVVASTTEEIIREYAEVISKLTKEMGILTIAVITLPSRKEKAKIRRPANDVAYLIEQTVATVAIPTNRKYWVDDSKEAEDDVFDTLGNYKDGWSLWYETKRYDMKFLKRTVSTKVDEGTISQVQVAVASIEKILKMLELNYINSVPNTAKEVLKNPGKLHIASAHNSLFAEDHHFHIAHRAYILERKVVESGPLGTDSMFSSKMLAHFIVPSDITQLELQYLCEHIPGRGDLNQFELAITVDDTLGDTIKAEVISTDTFNEEDMEDWE